MAALADSTARLSVASGGGLGGRGTIGGAVTVADGPLIGQQGQTLTMSAGRSVKLLDHRCSARRARRRRAVQRDRQPDAGRKAFGRRRRRRRGHHRLIDYGGDLIDRGLEIGEDAPGIAATISRFRPPLRWRSILVKPPPASICCCLEGNGNTGLPQQWRHRRRGRNLECGQCQLD